MLWSLVVIVIFYLGRTCHGFKLIAARTSVRVIHQLSRLANDEDVLAESYHSSFNEGIGKETILYADRDIIVVYKPANVQTAPGHIHKASLAGRVAETFGISRIDHTVVHRLDYSTSGVVVFARSDDALRNLHKQFRSKRKAQKEYVAIVVGNLQGTGQINLPIAKDRDRGAPFYRICHNEGVNASTIWSAEQSTRLGTLVRLKPITGR